MPTYTVHIPADARLGDQEAFVQSEIVKDAISLPALIFSVGWFLWHRMWLVSVGIVLLYVIFWTLAGILGIHPLAVAFSQSLIGIGLALEANSLRRWTLTRKGKPVRDVVMADDLEDAEAKAAARWLSMGASGTMERPAQAVNPIAVNVSVPLAPSTRMGAGIPIIGLFPDTGGGR